MPIPFPKQSGGTARTRPSSSRGVSTPIYPANDRYFGAGGSPKARPAPSGALSPNPFQAPSVSYGRPAPEARPSLYPSGTVARSAFGGLGGLVAKGAGVATAVSFVDDVLGYGVALLAKGGLDYANRYPDNGWWEKRYGDFGPYVGYSGFPGTWRVANNTWHRAISGQAVSGGFTGTLAAPWAWAGNSYGIWYIRFSSGIYRFAHHSSYFRVTNPLAASNAVWTYPAAGRGWAYAGFIDPISQPVGAPSASSPMPYWASGYFGTNPFRSPVEQTHRGYHAPFAGAVGTDGPPPNIVTTITQTPGRKPPFVSNVTAPAAPKPPKAGTQERKWVPLKSGGGSAIIAGIGLVTESLDAVGALWKALPKEAKTGYYPLHYRDAETGEVKVYYKYRHKASVQDKISDLIKGFGQLDGEKAISNLIDEAIEDRIYGGIGKAVQKSRAAGYRNVNGDFNAQRAKYGRRYRDLIKRRKGDEYVDFGPRGRGYQSGSGFHN